MNLIMRKNGKIVYPQINSYDKSERTMAKLAVIIKNEYKLNDLTYEEIESAESIPGWSWNFTKEEILFLNKEDGGKVVDVNLNK